MTKEKTEEEKDHSFESCLNEATEALGKVINKYYQHSKEDILDLIDPKGILLKLENGENIVEAVAKATLTGYICGVKQLEERQKLAALIPPEVAQIVKFIYGDKENKTLH